MRPSPGRDTAAPADLNALLDTAPWRDYHTVLIALTALTIVFDGIDIQLLGVVMPTVMQEWGLPRSAFAPVVSAAYLGMMIGGALAGIAGDRFGRRTALLTSMVVFGLATIAIAFSHGVASLAWFRLTAGIGLGGALPNAASLAAEFAPRRARPVAVTVTIVCVPLGAMIAGLLGIRALGVFGWRALFVAGGVLPIVVAVVLWTVLPESPHFLLRRRRWPELARLLQRMGHAVGEGTTFTTAVSATAPAPVRAIFERGLIRDTLALWGAFFSCLLSVYLGFGWLTTLLTGAGFSSSFASGGITAFNLGGVIGAIGGSLVIARWGSRTAMLTMTAGAIAGALALALRPLAVGAEWSILALLTLTGGLTNAVQTTMYAVATHVYPPAARATGVGAAVAIGRLGAIASGYIGAWVLGFSGSVAYFGMLAAAMTVCLVSLALVQRHLRPSRDVS